MAGVNRSTVYATHLAAKSDEQEFALLALSDIEYMHRPFYGSRKIRIYLQNLWHKIPTDGNVMQLAANIYGDVELCLHVNLSLGNAARQKPSVRLAYLIATFAGIIPSGVADDADDRGGISDMSRHLKIQQTP